MAVGTHLTMTTMRRPYLKVGHNRAVSVQGIAAAEVPEGRIPTVQMLCTCECQNASPAVFPFVSSLYMNFITFS